MSKSPPWCNFTLPELPYSCNNPYPNCTNPFGFQFSSLWTITSFVAQCPDDKRLFDWNEPSLTLSACESFVGRTSFTAYPAADIWARVTLWKFPLIQLIAVLPRPPLSFSNEAFVVAHLLGNPIGTLKSLLLKIANCQTRAEFWVDRSEDDLGDLIEGEGDERCNEIKRKWKALAIIVDAYDEWGFDRGRRAQDFLYERLSQDVATVSTEEKIEFLSICQGTADALAADRATQFLPVVAAQIIFIGSIAIAFGRTPAASEGPNANTYINIEAHSIAFSALYFWLIPAVLLGSIIGASQTENAIPRILRQFQVELNHSFSSWEQGVPNEHLFDGQREVPATTQRQKSGGIYSWQPEDVRKALIADIESRSHDKALRRQLRTGSKDTPSTLLIRLMRLAPGSWKFSFLMVLFSLLAGLLVSALVPPDGFWCRDWAELSIAVVWILSDALDYLPVLFKWNSEDRYPRIYRLIFHKDVLLGLCNIAVVIAIQVGIMNQCSCYSIEGRTGLAFPEISTIAGTLTYNIYIGYPAIAFLCIGFELLVFPGIVCYQYKEAFSVFMQRDNGESNFRHWHSFRRSRLVEYILNFSSWLVTRNWSFRKHRRHDEEDGDPSSDRTSTSKHELQHFEQRQGSTDTPSQISSQGVEDEDDPASEGMSTRQGCHSHQPSASFSVPMPPDFRNAEDG